MDEKALIETVGRSLYWGHCKGIGVEPGKWLALKEEDRKLWRGLARRAYRKIQEVAPAEPKV